MNTNHTPTPWTNDNGRIRGERGFAVADILWQNPSTSPDGMKAGSAAAEANAAHIVRCVNTHDELIYALDRLLALATEKRLGHLPCAEYARAALAKVQA